MQFRSVVTALIFALSVTACSTVNKVVYRIDVPQGNYLEASKVTQLKTGMTAQQVQYLLGTPVLIDPYSNHTWYYVYLQQKAYETPEQHTLVVHFDQNDTVSNFDLDKPLPNDGKVEVNNTIITAPDAQAKRWWQFWK
ncbi:outer membrane protein assembly factor BamE [Aggregatibacter actinomycetemcomitans]|uniref:Outer membrane protein assembly factor BamE n=1 Tax=Aggregatibacter actinomycetemcomitans serotype e str. SC1083 TaxID=907488 RepID=G4AB99_AGGAC|nr:outer membrane protein assembly factor BamE [Aggregatibacter actinomycetemcomitans]EGY32440.1 SmpA protein [Aggregatibacter actinomycetemcomitans serotype e str. SC1083]EHK90493.1 SmpA protein [Aggregatibacter actinomycetemcomitans RhAA1]KNE77551.1 membrane protein SmpA [Aggregatibacter actinomycetemcomitans RhAA1]KYK73348.1 membrane protein SmpA [Aggregatibacter actinomycetemcomitans serotype e str. SA3096]KYK77925.1 membrane protein SmpA [Aggregatibacter actinomycetemcomitans serotype e s